jgi:hypothetical protein
VSPRGPWPGGTGFCQPRGAGQGLRVGVALFRHVTRPCLPRPRWPSTPGRLRTGRPQATGLSSASVTRTKLVTPSSEPVPLPRCPAVARSPGWGCVLPQDRTRSVFSTCWREAQPEGKRDRERERERERHREREAMSLGLPPPVAVRSVLCTGMVRCRQGCVCPWGLRPSVRLWHSSHAPSLCHRREAVQKGRVGRGGEAVQGREDAGQPSSEGAGVSRHGPGSAEGTAAARGVRPLVCPPSGRVPPAVSICSFLPLVEQCLKARTWAPAHLLCLAA